MDIKEYIESGILEEYVLGHKLNPKIEKLALQYPEIQQEIEKIEKTLEVFAQLHRIQPPTNMLDDILKHTQTIDNK